MRRHMLRMARGGRDRRIDRRRRDGPRGEGRVIVGVDQIVRRAGMIGMRLHHGLEDRAGALLPAVCLVVEVDALDDREPVERGDIGVVGIGGTQRVHAVGVSAGPGHLVGIRPVVDAHRIDQAGLARAHARHLQRAIDESLARGETFRIERAAERIAARAHRRAPQRNAAGRIARGNRREARGIGLERMQSGDLPFQRRLRAGGAGVGEVDRAIAGDRAARRRAAETAGGGEGRRLQRQGQRDGQCGAGRQHGDRGEEQRRAERQDRSPAFGVFRYKRMGTAEGYGRLACTLNAIALSPCGRGP